MKFKLLYLFSLIGFLAKAQSPCQHLKSNGSHNTTQSTAPANLRSDTIDVLKTTINLDITDFTTNQIAGNTSVQFVPKINAQNHINFDLLKFTVDSVKMNGFVLSTNYNDTLLRVNFTGILNIGDTSVVTVYYHGTPQGDPSGFGGFAYSGGYAYNLGVGFDADPHVYGRTWFPCFDNFVERCVYEFNITTSNGKVASCNGELMSDITNGALRTRKWVLNKEVPSYLVCVAVAPYTIVHDNYSGLLGNVPVELTAVAADTTNLKNSFIHLQNAFDGFESHYGPYRWNKVGYVLVPFNGGAMEHATNIAYPRFGANGALTYEDILMSHELSHHWWGDLVTCETQEDMWINEGMASFSAFLFNEVTYNYATYLSKVKQNHDEQVHFSHHIEGGFRAISGIPHQYTYGEHVYNKGADVAHTMRGYLGDSLFFAGLKYVLNQKQFQSMNSIEFQNLMTTGTGVNMQPFFNDWVLNGGWPHFSIDSVVYSGSLPNITATVYVKQKLYGAPNYFTNVPMEITFMDANRVRYNKTIMCSGQNSSASFNLNFMPVYAGINLESKISDAISSEYKTIKATGAISFGNGRATLTVMNAGVDSTFLRVEHNFANADPIKNNVNNYLLGDNRYWKIDGVLANGFHSKLQLNFNGNYGTSGLNTYLDTLVVDNGGVDSLICLYRANTADDWHEVSKYTRTKQGGPSGKFGYVTIDTLKLGEYCFAHGVSNVLVGLNQNQTEGIDFAMYPNPTKASLTLELKNKKQIVKTKYTITNAIGSKILEAEMNSNSIQIDTSKLSKGVYYLTLQEQNGSVSTKEFIISN